MIKKIAFVALLLLVIVFASGVCLAQSFIQWAAQAEATSSMYNDPERYSPSQMLGRPDVYPDHRDSGDAWCPEYMDSWWVWVTLYYPEPVIAEKIEIYETYNPGAVSQVHLIDEYGILHPVWQGEAGPKGEQARIFTIDNIKADVPCVGIFLTLQPDKVPGWNMIDAVSLTGHEPGPAALGYLGQWAVHAESSTQYGSDRYAAHQMTGTPNVYPNHGDYPAAWAPSEMGRGEEWAILTYEKAIVVDRVDIYETCNPGAIVKVELIDDFGSRFVIWQGAAGPSGENARIFHVHNNVVDIPCRKVRLTLDTAKVPSWNEIDAVALVGTVDNEVGVSASDLSGTADNKVYANAPDLGGLVNLVEDLEVLLDDIRSKRAADPWVLDTLEAWLAQLRKIGTQLR